jgi:hypothetical protein
MKCINDCVLGLAEHKRLFLSEKGALSRAEIEEHTGFKRTKVLEELGQMFSDGRSSPPRVPNQMIDRPRNLSLTVLSAELPARNGR